MSWFYASCQMVAGLVTVPHASSNSANCCWVLFDAQSIMLTALGNAEVGKTWFLPRSSSSRGRGIQNSLFNTEGMERVQSNHKRRPERKGSRKATQRPQISCGPWRKRSMSLGDEGKDVSPLMGKIFKGGNYILFFQHVPDTQNNTLQKERADTFLCHEWKMSGFWTNLTAQRQRGWKGTLCLGNSKWSDVAALNTGYRRKCCGR